jgi:hypothetical protein
MDQKFLLKQVSKLFKNKTIIVLDDSDLEDLIIAAVPNLNLEADDLENGSHGDRVQANRLRLLASDLNSIPNKKVPSVVNISKQLN